MTEEVYSVGEYMEPTGIPGPNSHNELDALHEAVDTCGAREFFSMFEEEWKSRHAKMRAGTLVPHFVVPGDFDLDSGVKKRYGKD